MTAFPEYVTPTPVNPFTSPVVALPTPPRTGFSRHDEEAIVLRYFETHAPRYGMRLVDFGAFDGLENSHSRALVMRGWHAVLVEAAASATLDLMKNCRGFKNTRVVQAFVTGDPFTHPSSLAVLQHTRDAHSTMDPQVFSVHRPVTKDYFPLMVPVLKVSQFLAAFPGPYDFVTLTTGGESTSILIELLAAVSDISLIAIEHAPGGVDELPTLRAAAKAKHYHELSLNATTVIFGREPLDLTTSEPS